jgi:subtilisin family serine protease
MFSKMKRSLLVAPALLLFVIALIAPGAGAQSGDRPPEADGAQAPVIPAPERGRAGQYIVVLKPGSNPQSVAAVAGVNPRYVYTTALSGFAATLNDGQLTALRRNANVSYIEQDAEVRIDTHVTWGLDRIDQRSLPLSDAYTTSNTGAGVRAYIIDTGVRFDHAELGGRAVSGYDAVDGGSADDCNGHGTHVAGTVGGSTYGVAKSVALIAVRVLDCGGSGSWSGVISGIDWVTANHVKPAVANMSLGGGGNTSVDAAVRSSIAAGVTYAIAAGNGNVAGIAQDACKYSPARVAEAITIGATDKTDKKAPWSNYGNCVDFFAPGVSITSAWSTSSSATNTISGTSMATPHATGVAALFLQTNTAALPQQVRDALYSDTTKGIVSSSRTANNHLLFTN